MTPAPVEVTAAVLRASDAPFALEEITLEPPADDEVVVRIAGVGICQSDLLARTPLVKPPVIAGHEGAGIVEAVGARVSSLVPGDHVVLSFDSCAMCESCLSAAPSYCDTFWRRNLTGYRADRTTNATDADGQAVAGRWFGQSSFATHSVVAARNAVKVDPAAPLELLGPLACGLQTGAGAVLNSLRLRTGSSLVVFGTGSVGLSAIMAAKLAGLTTIVGVDLSPARLALATELGATHVIDGAAEDLAAQLRTIAPRGFHASLDATGVPDVISTAIGALRPAGVCGLLGSVRKDLTIRPEHLSAGVTLRSIVLGDAVPQLFIPVLIELWRQGRFPFERLVETFPLAQINEAEQAARSGAAVKPVLLPA